MHSRGIVPRHLHSPSAVNADASDPKKKTGLGMILLVFLLGFLLFLATAFLFLKDLASQIAISDASDAVTAQVNRVIAEIMRDGKYEADAFVHFEKNSNGEVTAISSNMSSINALSAEILERVVGATENHTMTVRIPLGNLTGISLLMGRGPTVPVQIIVLTSSRVGFNNSIVTAGINQTKHQITLDVLVDVDILVPWGTENTQVKTDVLIADTIVVGQVPGTYLNLK